jgi:hypothetical protein
LRVLSLDISTKTGWAAFDMNKGECKLIDCGVLPQLPEPADKEYPDSYLQWSAECYMSILNIWDKFNPDFIVIEETAKGSKSSGTQKILEWIHYRVAQHIVDLLKQGTILGYRYYMTEEWRRITGCQMNAEEKKNNAKRSREKTKAKKKGNSITVIKDKEGNRLGRITKKHVNVRRANEIFGLDLILKDEDKADALILGYAHYVENFQ